jgi:acyl carrier protein
MSADQVGSTGEVEVRVREFLEQEVGDHGRSIDREADLLSGGVLDSMAVVRLASFVGGTFGFQVQPEDFVIENFRSVGAITAYIIRARAAQWQEHGSVGA